MKTGVVTRSLITLLLITGAVCSAAAQRAPRRAPTPPAAVSPDPRAALVDLENAWARALVRRDVSTFQRLLAPAFVYTENDQLMTRQQVISSITGSDTITEAHNEDMVVHPYATNAAVVTGWLVVRGRNAAGRFLHRYRFTDTWVATNGRWQIVAAQDYLAPAATR